jgi:hypothetical protein
MGTSDIYGNLVDSPYDSVTVTPFAVLVIPVMLIASPRFKSENETVPAFAGVQILAASARNKLRAQW